MSCSQRLRDAVRPRRRDRVQVPLPLAPQGLAAAKPYRAIRGTDQTLDLLFDDGRAHFPVLIAHHCIDAVGDPQAARVIGRSDTRYDDSGDDLQVLRRLERGVSGLARKSDRVHESSRPRRCLRDRPARQIPFARSVRPRQCRHPRYPQCVARLPGSGVRDERCGADRLAEAHSVPS